MTISIYFTVRIPLDTGQNGRHIVGGTPSILEDIQAQLSGGIYIWVEHLADELDGGRFVWVLLFKVHDKSECAILEWGICWSDDYSVPAKKESVRERVKEKREFSYQVMTLSATGEAETPAGGSVCMRCEVDQYLLRDRVPLFLFMEGDCHQP